eukprot:CAMPEP_0170149522 /NCGR_PEP_ID=MMETSP0033_2-20121228/43171_2 /TAXON_ID=195969 /ORGANISM="Dolichomastix tenuilepis, Strain CCMP3274" /LENGTH=53 /DNA_ID=CAMNT_0010386477 /DNA_START=1 /DNA_END=159 /DNA_ORIENTATION=-
MVEGDGGDTVGAGDRGGAREEGGALFADARVAAAGVTQAQGLVAPNAGKGKGK